MPEPLKIDVSALRKKKYKHSKISNSKEITLEPIKNFYIYGIKFTPKQIDILIRVVEEEKRQYIKSAIEGLRKDLDELHSEVIGRNDDRLLVTPFEFVKKIEVIDLIKKWFPDVLEDDKK